MKTDLVASARVRIIAGQQALLTAWRESHNGSALLRARAVLVDGVLRDIWSALELPADLALVAVGGYGGGKLYPFSDVDLLILLPEGFDPAAEPKLEQLIGMLWDIGLDLGHSVRTAQECLDVAV